MRDALVGFAFLDMKTLVIMSVALYVALTVIMIYTYWYRQTYPGFGAFTLSQILWNIGIVTVYFRFLGQKPSLLIGNSLLMLQTLFLYYGITLYGEIDHRKRRILENFLIFLIAEISFVYFIFIRYDTCARVLVFSGFTGILYFRIGAEPYCLRRWKTYSLQPIFATINCFIGTLFFLRFLDAWGRTECHIGGSDNLTKFYLLLTSLFFPLLTYSLLAMTSGRVEAELRETRDALRQQAETDPLTGLPNRRHFLGVAQRTLEAARELGTAVSFLMIDLDYFKNINDRFGHQTGDLVLRGVARCLAEAVRDEDTVGRLGGEEFGVLLPGLETAAAVRVAHRLRRAVADSHPGGHAVTASLGVASGAADLDALLARADECLYAAKGAGRNQVASLDVTSAPAIIAEETAG